MRTGKNPLWYVSGLIVGRCPKCGGKLIFDTKTFRATAYCSTCDCWFHTGVVAGSRI